ncbi:YicC/YloC family endoribonuclease [Peptococcus simiae]|uniref:YicC/YloC family endoribonuclease n=1 Tax=Peptococcus simiae TaxID=1643805 RepID=UPI00397FB5A1
MRSMTGFGAGTAENAQWHVSVAIHSVNHKRLDWRISMPQILRPYEVDLRQALSQEIFRGNISVEVRLEDLAAGQARWAINESLLSTVASHLSSQVGEGAFSRQEWLALLQIPHMIEDQVLTFDEEDKPLIFQALQIALANYRQATLAEGNRLAADLDQRLEKCAANLRVLQEVAPRVRQQLEDKLREKLEEVLGQAGINEQRLMEELVYFMNRTSIEEELVRLDSHIKKLRDLFKEEGPIGREADFYLQEMNREVNTCGSKINDTRGSHAVVELKTLIDAMREQIQNIA